MGRTRKIDRRHVQQGGQRFARNRVARRAAETTTDIPEPAPITTCEAEAPSREAAPVRPPHATDPRRWADGTQRPGAPSLARKYPQVQTDDPAVARHLAEEAARIVEDRGGRECLSTLALKQIDRLVVLGLFVEHWEAFFLRAGIHTKHGRVRSGYVQGYLRTLDSFARLAQQIGVTRETRPVRLSTRQWLEGDDQTGETDETSQTEADPDHTEAGDGSSARDQH